MSGAGFSVTEKGINTLLQEEYPTHYREAAWADLELGLAQKRSRQSLIKCARKVFELPIDEDGALNVLHQACTHNAGWLADLLFDAYASHRSLRVDRAMNLDDDAPTLQQDEEEGKAERLTPLEWAAWMQADQVVEALVRRGHLETLPAGREGWPLGLALLRHSKTDYRGTLQSPLSTLQLLLDGGVDPNALGPRGRHPLCLLPNPYLTSISENAQAAALLLNAGSNPRNTTGALRDAIDIPLVHAALYGTAAGVRLLLEAGADPQEKHLGGGSVLHALCGTREELVEQASLSHLVAHGADVNEMDPQGRSPLMLTVQQGFPLTITCHLQSLGALADPNPSLPTLFCLMGASSLTEDRVELNFSIYYSKFSLQHFIAEGCDVNQRVAGRHLIEVATNITLRMIGKMDFISDILEAGWVPRADDAMTLEAMAERHFRDIEAQTLDTLSLGDDAASELMVAELLEHAVDAGWLDLDGGIQIPSPKMQTFLGSAWQRRLLEKETPQAPAAPKPRM